MPDSTPLRAIRKALSGLPRDEGGVSAAEFALILPVMLLILVATVEAGHAVDNYRKVTRLARTVSDLTAQGDKSSPIAAATMDDILASAKLVLLPFDSTKATIVVSAMGYYSKYEAKPYVCSSIGSNVLPRTAKATATDLSVPAPFQVTGGRYILTEVSMPYTPMLGSAIVKLLNSSASYTLKHSMSWPVRGGAIYYSTIPEVIMPSGVSCPA